MKLLTDAEFKSLVDKEEKKTLYVVTPENAAVTPWYDILTEGKIKTLVLFDIDRIRRHHPDDHLLSIASGESVTVASGFHPLEEVNCHNLFTIYSAGPVSNQPLWLRLIDPPFEATPASPPAPMFKTSVANPGS